MYKLSRKGKTNAGVPKQHHYQKDVVSSRPPWATQRDPVSLCLKKKWVRHWWLMPVILATQEAEIRRTAVQSQPRQIVHKTLS
jgi:hypothetical protein